MGIEIKGVKSVSLKAWIRNRQQLDEKDEQKFCKFLISNECRHPAFWHAFKSFIDL